MSFRGDFPSNLPRSVATQGPTGKIMGKAAFATLSLRNDMLGILQTLQLDFENYLIEWYWG